MRVNNRGGEILLFTKPSNKEIWNFGNLNFDGIVKSQKVRFPVIPANPGSGPGQAPESSYFKHLKILWTPVFTGVTTFYEIVNFEFVQDLGIRI